MTFRDWSMYGCLSRSLLGKRVFGTAMQFSNELSHYCLLPTMPNDEDLREVLTECSSPTEGSSFTEMNSDEDKKPGVVGVATSGIQDVSALLPLLGTEQCERLVTSALQRGLLYAAATPMSIFGSLGIVKAGFVILCASIDCRYFPGPTLLRNAGFTATGMGGLLNHVAESNRHLYIAEDKIRCHMSKIRIRSVKINLLSKDLWFWNLCLICSTVLLSSFGLLPYVYLIVRFLPDEPFRTTWLYPVIRIAGCDMVAISIQFILQLRVLEEAYCRIRFLATDSYLKDYGRSVPAFWDPNERSRTVLSQLKQHVGNVSHATVFEKQEPEEAPTADGLQRKPSVPIRSVSIDEYTKKPIVEGLGRITSFSFPVYEEATSSPSPQANSVPAIPPAADPQQALDAPNAAEKGELSGNIDAEETTSVVRSARLITGLSPPGDYFVAVLLWITQASLLFRLGLSIVGYIGCFSVPIIPPAADPQQALDAPNAAEKGELSGNIDAEEPTSAVRSARLITGLSPPGDYFVTVLLWITQASLLFGLGLSIVGYIGCFSVVQASPRGNSRGPLVWLICEAILAIVRTLVWAWNPTWDDPKSPIALEKMAISHDGKVDLTKTKKSSYGVGWMLDAVTANDMHALVVGIDDFGGWGSMSNLHSGQGDATKIADYLRDTLLVPRGQVVTLLDSGATKERIVQELKALAHRTSVVDGAPIVIYFATHSRVRNGKTYLYPYVDARSENTDDHEPQRDMLAYSAIIDILKHVAEEKSDNITLILDTCSAGAMGVNDKFSTSHSEGADLPTGGTSHQLLGPLTEKSTEILVGHSSHILLAGTDALSTSYEKRGVGGLFTASLLKVLTKSEPGALGTMTYKDLVGAVNNELEQYGKRQRALCTTIYQNRLLFSGLFSRKLNEESSMPVITVQYSDL